MKNMVGAKAGNHSQEGELVKVMVSCEGEAATKETDYRFGGSLVQTLEPLKIDLVVVVDDGKFSFIQDKGCKPTEENWATIKKFNT